MNISKRQIPNWVFDVLLISLCIVIPYRQMAEHRFVEFDDGMYTFYNTHIMKGLTWESVVWAFTNIDVANWHPLTWISHLVDRELFGPYPGGYLLSNMAWHILAATLCYFALLKVTASRLFAFSVAIIFALHPANVENVAWASERKSTLDAIFWFAAIITYFRYLETRKFAWFGTTAVLHMLGLLCKAMSVTLPCTLVLMHFLYLHYHPGTLAPDLDWKSKLKRTIVPTLPLLAISLYFAAVTASAQKIAMAGAEYQLSERLINVTLSYGRYLEMFYHPTKFAVFYPLFQSELSWNRAMPVLGLLIAITGIVILLARSRPQLILGWLWYLGTMVPVIGLVQVGSQSHADRYLYIPMIGLSFLFPVLFEELKSITAKARAYIAGTWIALASISLIAATYIQVGYWQNGITLFSHSIEVTGDCVTSTGNLITAYARNEKYDTAIVVADMKIAIATNPVNKGKLTGLKSMLLCNQKKYRETIAAGEKALSLGSTELCTYWTLAMANFYLEDYKKVSFYLKKAKAKQTGSSDTSYTDVLLKMEVSRLGLMLAQKQSEALDRSFAPTALMGLDRLEARRIFQQWESVPM